ncbi:MULTISPECIES: hypothetical protein [unclassified Pseudomonas]|uniref:hypothetical protein n=1 Tax=unclassified Pseudomonas TaxID=196821 RepID=UPI00128B441A|nr:MULTISPECIES: hypothetical protein [unclassified Pseudomonas]MPQ71779.1 hypothetical protein [Pseudomonas sp. MWU12-2323]
MASTVSFRRIDTNNDSFGIEVCKVWIAQVDLSGLAGPEEQAIKLIEDALGKHEQGEKLDYD